jgi:hypothetical protein
MLIFVFIIALIFIFREPLPIIIFAFVVGVAIFSALTSAF